METMFEGFEKAALSPQLARRAADKAKSQAIEHGHNAFRLNLLARAGKVPVAAAQAAENESGKRIAQSVKFKNYAKKGRTKLPAEELADRDKFREMKRKYPPQMLKAASDVVFEGFEKRSLSREAIQDRKHILKSGQ